METFTEWLKPHSWPSQLGQRAKAKTLKVEPVDWGKHGVCSKARTEVKMGSILKDEFWEIAELYLEKDSKASEDLDKEMTWFD